jgi:hypothetical protein
MDAKKMSCERVEPRKCILVLGMHRSGTSALTRALNLFGSELPKHVLGASSSNETGHWEPKRLVALHNQMLAEAGSRWDDCRAFEPAALGVERLAYYKAQIAQLITEEYREAPLFVVKDPRICRFVPLYEEVLDTLGIKPLYVLMFRNPLAVAKSLKARDGMTAGFSSLIWLRHALDAEAAVRGKPFAAISYERLLADWEDVANELDALLNLDSSPHCGRTPVEIGTFISSELTHHLPSENDLTVRADISAWVKDAYRALLALERGHGDKDVCATFDKICAEFNIALSALADPLLNEMHTRIQTLTQTRSWRLTKPLRAAVNIYRRNWNSR